MTRIAFVFPGQGSQAPGMADALLDLPGAEELLDVAEANGLDLRAALDGDGEALRPTEIAQPALLFTGCLLGGVARAGLAPDLELIGVAGHSVGEYAALVVAGALTPAEAMRLVIERGRCMGAMRDGTMAALLGADAELAATVCAEVEVTGLGPVVVANHNAPGQVVLSGTRAGIAAAATLARERGVRRVMALNVGGAFHSPLMAAAAAGFARVLDGARLLPARVPVACNVDGAVVTGADEIQDRLRRQLVSPVRWIDCVATLCDLGCEAFVELGPGSVLTGLSRRIAPGVRAVSIAGAAEAGHLSERLAGVTAPGARR